MNDRHRVRGFTLLELLVVIFLAALTIGIVAARFSGATGGAELKKEARQLVALLRHTRSRAISQSLSLGIVSQEDGEQYQIQPDGEQIDLPTGIRIAINPNTEGAAISQPGVFFYPDGSSNGGTLQLQAEEGEISVLVNWLTGEVALAEQGQD